MNRIALLALLAALSAATAGAATRPATRPATVPSTRPAADLSDPAEAARYVAEQKQAADRIIGDFTYGWEAAPGAPEWVDRAIRSHLISRWSAIRNYYSAAARLPVMRAARIDPSVPPGANTHVFDDEWWLVSATYRTTALRDTEIESLARKALPELATQMAYYADPTSLPRVTNNHTRRVTDPKGTTSKGPDGEPIERFLVPVQPR